MTHAVDWALKTNYLFIRKGGGAIINLKGEGGGGSPVICLCLQGQRQN